ncbi:glycosyltransferase family 2 protein [Ramlibacter sp.]|uniref:glycosyltransferase family 2 protein n=1 Tax=Ramlibacter sp. TaxID=1917967 RepID=UPI002601EDE7|nr:glycosyltransferase family 2 protein [Ramlibacter sp.]MDB5957140.1 putative glycosyltransferase [Ramlibacter sp.]
MVPTRPELSIVVPVYGSEAVLPELVAQIEKELSAAPDVAPSHEIIFVCDRSPDDSWRVIQSLSARYPTVNGILLRMNAGQHNALMAGFGRARGRVIVTMDDDLQHSPRDIPALVRQLDAGHDIAYARFKNRQHKAWKVMGSRLNNAVADYLLQKPHDLYLSPFRAMKSEIRDEILKYRGPYVYIDGLILQATRNIATVDVDHHGRFAGTSRYGMRKSVSLWLKMATNFSIVPLRLTSLLGMIFSGLGFLLALFFVLQRFTINIMPVGWSSLIVTLLILGGAQLLALGMIGEYLGRVLLTINGRPQYVIDQTVGLAHTTSTEGTR